MMRLIIVGIILLSLWAKAIAQDQTAVNCTTVDQCRILVLVARGQLLSAQDSWAFWAYKAQNIQEQLEKVQKELQEKSKGDGDKDEKNK